MSAEQPTDWVGEVARRVPGIMRRLFGAPPEQSPLWDLPVPQIRALHMLRRGDRTMREVAGCLGVAMSTVTQLGDRLETLGLVERRADPADRRVVRLTLTEAGSAALAELDRQRRERISAAMGRLSAAEQEAVMTGLRLLERAAQEGVPAPEPPGRHPLWDMVTAGLQQEGSEKQV